MSDLRNKIIRLAYENPELRKDLLPLVTKNAGVGLRSWHEEVDYWIEGLGDRAIKILATLPKTHNAYVDYLQYAATKVLKGTGTTHRKASTKAGRTQTYGVAGQEMAGWYISVHEKGYVGNYESIKKVVQTVEKGWLLGAGKDFAAQVKKQIGILPKVSGHRNNEYVSIDLEFMLDDDDLAGTSFDWLDRWAKKWNLELE